jgi:hypothetical protein
MSAIAPLLGEKQTSGASAPNGRFYEYACEMGQRLSADFGPPSLSSAAGIFFPPGNSITRADAPIRGAAKRDEWGALHVAAR